MQRQARSLTVLEWWSVAFAALSLLLLYKAAAGELASGTPARNVAWLFLPHIVLIAMVVGGLRRMAAVVQTFVLAIGGVMALGLWLDAAFGGHSSSGYGVIAALQLPLFVFCFRSAKAPFSYGELGLLGPRLTLGALVAAIGWFAVGIALSGATAPARARDAAVNTGKRREWARRDAQTWTEALAACLQLSPVTADSQPFFPGTLAELPGATCPEAKQPAPEGFVLEYRAGDPDSSGKRRTFHLTVRDSATSDSARSYDVDESMVVTNWFGEGGRRYPSAAQQPLDILNRAGLCIELARDSVAAPGSDRYPSSVAEAGRRAACGVGITTDSSAFRETMRRAAYTIRYEPPLAPRPRSSPGGFTLLLEPQRDSLGRARGGALLSFFSDTGGVVHVSRRPRAATAADPAIPDCLTVFGYGGRNPAVPCREYRPRQRWGLASELPTIAMSMSGSGTLGIGEQLALLPHFQPLVEQDRPVEVRVRWDSGGRDTVLTRRRGVPFGKPIGNGIYFEFHHAWADTGMKRVEVRIVTEGREEYESRQDIHVVTARP